MDYQAFAHQEEKHFSNYSTFSSREGSYSKAFTKGKGDPSFQFIHGHYASGEDDTKYVFNFPGPGDLPLSPSSAGENNIGIQKGLFKGEEVSTDFSHSAKSKAESRTVPLIVTSSPESTRHVSARPDTLIISGSSNTDKKNWVLSPSEPQKKQVFAPQRSSTMNKSGNKTVSNLTSSSKSSKTSNIVSYSTAEYSGDKIVYEVIPISPNKVKSSTQANINRLGSQYGFNELGQGNNVSSFNINNNTPSMHVDTITRFPSSVHEPKAFSTFGKSTGKKGML